MTFHHHPKRNKQFEAFCHPKQAREECLNLVTNKARAPLKDLQTTPKNLKKFKYFALLFCLNNLQYTL